MNLTRVLALFVAALLLIAGAAGMLLFLYSWLLVGLCVAVIGAGAALLWWGMQGADK